MLTVWKFELPGPRHNGVVQPLRFMPCESAVLRLGESASTSTSPTPTHHGGAWLKSPHRADAEHVVLVAPVVLTPAGEDLEPRAAVVILRGAPVGA
jgi:hypothetical protein